MANISVKEQIFRFTDACYALDCSDQEWLSQLAAEARAFIDYGSGVTGWTFSKDNWTGAELPPGVDPQLGEAMWAAAKTFSSDDLVKLFMGGRATSATERLAMTQGLDEHPARDQFVPLRVKDFHGLTVWDGAGRGVVLAGAASRVLRTEPRQLARLERLGSHLLAGYRLRRALRKVDAVLDPSGRPVHAEGEAREPEHRDALSRAVRAFDHARSERGHAGADEALSAFAGLVAGRWSIVQTLESDGRRYLVAIQNPPGQIESSALSSNQAHAMLLRAQGLAYKVISYELGLSEAATHHLVQQGMAKLGVARETDLPLLFRNRVIAELARVSGDG